MYEVAGYGATIRIDGTYLVIDRGRVQSVTIGGRQVVALADLRGLHVTRPSRLVNGNLQLCVGQDRPPLGRTAAPSDPHTVLFRWGQRAKLDELSNYLRQIVDINAARCAIQTPVAPDVPGPVVESALADENTDPLPVIDQAPVPSAEVSPALPASEPAPAALPDSGVRGGRSIRRKSGGYGVAAW